MGDRVTLFNGVGLACVAEVIQIDKRGVDLAVRSTCDVNRELRAPLVLVVVPPTGERWRWLVEKAVELGVTRLVPLRSERSGAHVHPNRDRCERWVIEAAKQCGRNRLLELANVVSWHEFMASTFSPCRRFALDPCGPQIAGLCDPSLYSGVALAVGPEGGFTARERSDLEGAGWELLGMGPAILRVETAAIAALAVCRTALLPAATEVAKADRV